MSLSSRFYSEVKKARLPDAATDNDAEISPEDPDLDTQEADAIIANYAINLKDFEDEEDQIVKGGPGSGPAEGGGGSSTQAKIVEAKAREEKARIHRDSLRGAARDQANAEMRMAQQDKQSLMDRSRYESHQSMNKSENDSSSDVKKNDLEPKKDLVAVFKIDQHKQLVYGEVLVPDDVDSQGDYMSAEDIEKAAHSYLENSRVVGSSHTHSVQASPVESYIAPHDFTSSGPYGDQKIKKGSWILGVKIKDPDEWQKVLNGDYQGFSVGGFGTRV